MPLEKNPCVRARSQGLAGVEIYTGTIFNLFLETVLRLFSFGGVCSHRELGHFPPIGRELGTIANSDAFRRSVANSLCSANATGWFIHESSQMAGASA